MFVGKKIENNTMRLMPAVKIGSKKATIESEAEIQCPASSLQNQIKGKVKVGDSDIKNKIISASKIQKKPAQQIKIEKQLAKTVKTKPKPLNNIHIQNKINIKGGDKTNQDKGKSKISSKIEKKQLPIIYKSKINTQKQKEQKESVINKRQEAYNAKQERQQEIIHQPLVQQNEQTQIDEEDEVQLARQFLPNPLPHNKIFGQILQFQDSLLEPQYFPPQQHKNEFLPQQYSFNTPQQDIELNMQLFQLDAEELLALDYLAI